MKSIVICLLSSVVLLSACDGEPTVTSRYKQVETQTLILTDQHGKAYSLQVDKEGNVKAVEVKQP